MTKKLFFPITILLVAAFTLMAADVSGKWTYEQPSRGGGQARPVTITLKQDGDKLTGSVPGFARGGTEAPGHGAAVLQRSAIVDQHGDSPVEVRAPVADSQRRQGRSRMSRA